MRADDRGSLGRRWLSVLSALIVGCVALQEDDIEAWHRDHDTETVGPNGEGALTADADAEFTLVGGSNGVGAGMACAVSGCSA